MSSRFMTATLAALFLLAGCNSDQKDPDQPLAAYKPSPEKRSSDPVYLYLDALRSDLSRDKAQILNRVMKLTPADAEKFWPIYRQYEAELYALGDQRTELTRRFAVAINSNTLDDSSATQMGNAWWDYESQRTTLMKKYYDRLAKEVSPIRAAQFAQIEHRVATVVDLVVASEVPLVRTR